MRRRLVDADEAQQMTRAYLAGATLTEAAAVCGYDRHAAKGALLKAGIPLRSRSEAQRWYPFNDRFFAFFDTEE